MRLSSAAALCCLLMICPWSGINEAGVVVGTMQLLATAHPDPDERPPFAAGTWVQYVLDTCGSLSEVIAVDVLERDRI